MGDRARCIAAQVSDATVLLGRFSEGRRRAARSQRLVQEAKRGGLIAEAITRIG